MYGNRGDMQRQTAVTVYFSSKQLLLFDFAAHTCILCWCWVSRFEFVSKKLEAVNATRATYDLTGLWPVTFEPWPVTHLQITAEEVLLLAPDLRPDPVGPATTWIRGGGGDTPCHTRVWPALLPPRGFPLTISVRGPTLDVWIWRLQASDSNV